MCALHKNTKAASTAMCRIDDVHSEGTSLLRRYWVWLAPLWQYLSDHPFRVANTGQELLDLFEARVGQPMETRAGFEARLRLFSSNPAMRSAARRKQAWESSTEIASAATLAAVPSGPKPTEALSPGTDVAVLQCPTERAGRL